MLHSKERTLELQLPSFQVSHREKNILSVKVMLSGTYWERVTESPNEFLT